MKLYRSIVIVGAMTQHRNEDTVDLVYFSVTKWRPIQYTKQLR